MRPAEKDSSPRSTGPAGSQFETKVGTHYALALLANTEPLGLPGAVVDRLEFQRGGQGHPLDDVIVRGVTPQGEDRCLEVQVKRSMAFTENDANFQSVVDGIVRAREIEPDEPMLLYNLACVYSLAGEIDESLDCLEQAIDNGFTHVGWVRQDSNLDALREHVRFPKLMKRLEAIDAP